MFCLSIINPLVISSILLTGEKLGMCGFFIQFPVVFLNFYYLGIRIYNFLDPLQQEEIRIEVENKLPDFWKVQLNKERVKGKTSKMLEAAIEEKRREIIKEWIDSGRIKA
jgi:hypothetical protein